MAKHSPTPWRLHVGKHGECSVWPDDKQMAICALNIEPKLGIGAAEARANAEFIVRACNAHDDLLAGLESLLFRFELVCGDDSGIDPADQKRIDTARAAIAKATMGK